MISRLDTIAGIGRDYVAALLQLHLGIGFVVALVSYSVASNTQFRERLRTVPWQIVVKAVEVAAAPLLLLSAYALVQLQAEAMNFLHLVALIVAGSSVVVGTVLTLLIPMCDGGDDAAQAGEESAQSRPRYTKVLSFLNVVKAMGQLLLLSAAFPGMDRSQLVCASALARLALFTEAVEAIMRALGFEDGEVILACSDIVKVLSSTSLVSALALMADMQVVEDIWHLPFQPMFYCALGLYSLIGITLVLDICCGGGCLAGSASHKREMTIKFAAQGVFAIGLLASIGSIVKNACTIELQKTGLRIEWGEPLVAIAVAIASLAFLAELADLLSPRMDALTPSEEGADAEKSALPGISEPMKEVTARASCLVLTLVATHIAVGNCPEDSFDVYWMTLTSPLRLGFLLCACVMFAQILMIATFSILDREVEPTPVPNQLLSAGLLMGIVSMGVSAFSLLGLVLIVLIYLFLPQQGKCNVNKALGSIATCLMSCFGVIGKRVERFLEWRRKLAEEKAAEQAALREKEMLAATDHNIDGKKSKAEPVEPKKKQPNPSPKKATNKNVKKKSTM